MTPSETFAEWLKRKRMDRKFTQKQLAEILEVSQKRVGKWEEGKAEPYLSIYRRIIEVFPNESPELTQDNQLRQTAIQFYAKFKSLPENQQRAVRELIGV